MRDHIKTRFAFVPILLILLTSFSHTNAKIISLAVNGNTVYSIVAANNSSVSIKFACQELKKYLDQISSSNFNSSENIADHSIVTGTVSSLQYSIPGLDIPLLQNEEYGIFRRGQNIYLTGGNEAAVLYAVYDFLSALGCRWIAPDFDFYEGKGQSIPRKTELIYNETDDIIRKPVFKYRKLYIEEGLSHNTENLKQLIDWMPKARFNTLVAPMNYQGNGKVKWDNWREQLIPELNKRGITIEVGGHGYQNFLNASMDNGKLYKKHPEWFGLYKNRERSTNPHIVFCTSNSEAVAYLQRNLLAYLKDHPEIDIFDFWPPDSEAWCMCDNCKAMGSEADRHAILVSQTAHFLQKELPGLKLECLAYSRYVKPPQNEIFSNNILLDFCPIRQSFEHQIFSNNDKNNKAYKEYLLSWLKIFNGDISIYSYYRKYAWRSLPVIIPHYMQNDLQFYRDCGTRGISVYSEPGDWFTYGLNHYVLSRLAWDPDSDVDKLITEYCSILYGPASQPAIEIYNELENIVRFGCKIPHTQLKDTIQYNQYLSDLEACKQKTESAINENIDNKLLCKHLHRLELMIEYATRSTLFMKYTSEEKAEKANKIATGIKQLMKENATAGVFIPR